MKVDEKLTLEQYDTRCKTDWPSRIPMTQSLDLQERLGDCIYDYSSGSAKLRPSVHCEDNVETDLSGGNVLVANEFYYFGSKAIQLPESLLDLCHQTQGHKSNSNSELFTPFVEWIRNQDYKPGYCMGGQTLLSIGRTVSQVTGVVFEYKRLTVTAESLLRAHGEC